MLWSARQGSLDPQDFVVEMLWSQKEQFLKEKDLDVHCYAEYVNILVGPLHVFYT